LDSLVGADAPQKSSTATFWWKYHKIFLHPMEVPQHLFPFPWELCNTSCYPCGNPAIGISTEIPQSRFPQSAIPNRRSRHS